MSKTKLMVACMSVVVGLGSGCAMEQKQVEQGLQQPPPINCATADGDMRVLQSEKANVAQRMVEGVTAVYPAGAVLGIVTGVEGTKVKVAIGEYNKAIDARISEIERTCGLQ